jgi:hypothetical protein
LLQRVSKLEGLQYNNIISLFVDRSKNLGWRLTTELILSHITMQSGIFSPTTRNIQPVMQLIFLRIIFTWRWQPACTGPPLLPKQTYLLCNLPFAGKKHERPGLEHF